jgi:hypothetical protein
MKGSRLEESEFDRRARNPLTELSELRLELLPSEGDFSLKCLLKFSVMHLEHGGQEFDVGVSRAILRLGLEGCETEMGSNFGERSLSPVEEVNTAGVAKSGKGKATTSANLLQGVSGGLDVEVEGNISRASQRTQTLTNFPVRALPNDAWKVCAPSVAKGRAAMIDGTAIGGELLCKLQRAPGGNRMALSAELQARKGDLEVTQRAGNTLGRLFGARLNRDALIGIIVGRAIEREASSVGVVSRPETIVISKYEITERS